MQMSEQDVVAAYLACVLAQGRLERLKRQGNLSNVGYQQLTDVTTLKDKLDKYMQAEKIKNSITIA